MCDQNFCEMIFYVLHGLVDKHITQRHIQYNKTAERRIGFNRIRKVLDSDDSIKDVKNTIYTILKINC